VTSNQAIRWILKPVAFAAALGPAGWLVWAAATGNFSADPLADITKETGIWTLRFLCLTLAVTPLRRLSGWTGAIRFRRMLGLFAFFYGTLHLLIYLVADRLASLDFPNGIVALRTVRDLAASVWTDIYKRPFITIGFTTWVCMAPLAATSTSGMIRRLGGRRWNLLHRLIYAAAIAGVVHYWWGVKADTRPPAVYAAIVGVLLTFRIVWAGLHRARPAAARPAALTERS
jgi:sulfoxide reductase heme-binding subunit YedZ